MCLKDTRKFIFLTPHLARVHFLSKDTKPVKRKVKIGNSTKSVNALGGFIFFTQRLGRVHFLSNYKCVHKITGDGRLTPRHQTKLPMGNFYILY